VKKFILLTVVFCLVLSVLIACDKEEAPVTETETETEAAETTKTPDKYDKYRGDNSKPDDGKTPSGGQTPSGGEDPEPPKQPEIKKEGYGEEFDWDDGAVNNG
jgi:hypothetical protein